VRILVANEHPSQLDTMASAVEALGEDVVAREVRVTDAAQVAEAAAVELALVGLSPEGNAEHALALIAALVGGGRCPVVVVGENVEAEFLADAAALGVYAHASRLHALPLRSAIDVASRRFNDQAHVQAVLEKRTLIERAKGILMERYQLDEHAAFQMLRREARNENLRLTDAAELILQGHRLLPKNREPRRHTGSK
jgi:two-component system, response regulator / RNA-binding antiterminator